MAPRPVRPRATRSHRITTRFGNRGAVPSSVKDTLDDLAAWLTTAQAPQHKVRVSVYSALSVAGRGAPARLAEFRPGLLTPENGPTVDEFVHIAVAGSGVGPLVRDRSLTWADALDALRLAVLREYVRYERWAAGKAPSEVGVTVKVRRMLRDYHAARKTGHRRTVDPVPAPAPAA